MSASLQDVLVLAALPDEELFGQIARRLDPSQLHTLIEILDAVGLAEAATPSISAGIRAVLRKVGVEGVRLRPSSVHGSEFVGIEVAEDHPGARRNEKKILEAFFDHRPEQLPSWQYRLFVRGWALATRDGTETDVGPSLDPDHWTTFVRAVAEAEATRPRRK